MAEAKIAPPKSAAAESENPEAIDEAERALGRAVARGLPAVSVAAAIAVGLASGVGAALLVLAAGALLGTIAFLWASLRTLSGEAALPLEIEALAARGGASTDLRERKIRAQRAIKDLESEHALGRLDDAEYDELVARYRDEAKELMRAMDRETAPERAEAERLVREFLAKRKSTLGEASVATEGAAPARLACEGCGGSNDVDAAFCKHCGAKMKREAKVSDATS